MGHNHNHTHNHSHIYTDLKGKNLLISIILNILITISQVIGGLISGSLSLLSDALHNFSDVISLIVSYIANRLSRKEASIHRTFGYKRAEILAAFVNASALIVVAILLINAAIERFSHPKNIATELVIWLSLFGIIMNGLSVLLLKKDAQSNLNMKSAYLHLFTDMMASVAVLIGGIFMKIYGGFWVDSVLTLAIAVYLIYMGYDLLKDSTKMLMLFTPDNIPVNNIVTELNGFESIENVHHVHVWQLNERELHFEAHIDFNKDISLSKFDNILQKIEAFLLEKYEINHVNIQPEFRKDDPKDMIVQD